MVYEQSPYIVTEYAKGTNCKYLLGAVVILIMIIVYIMYRNPINKGVEDIVKDIKNPTSTFAGYQIDSQVAGDNQVPAFISRAPYGRAQYLSEMYTPRKED